MTTTDTTAPITTVAIPDPASTPDIQITRLCTDITAWAAGADDIDAVKEAKARLEAIDLYIARTSSAGRAEVAATLRRLEVRIGQLLGPAEVGSHSSATEGPGLTKDQRHEFRQMAEHPDIVEQTIAASSDDKPASRRQVLTKIAVAENAAMLTESPSAQPQITDEDRDRQDIQKTIGQLRVTVEAIKARATPEQVHWALTTGNDQVARLYRTNFVQAVTAINDYAELL